MKCIEYRRGHGEEGECTPTVHLEECPLNAEGALRADMRRAAKLVDELQADNASLTAALRSVLALVDTKAFMTAEQQRVLWAAEQALTKHGGG